MLVSHRKNFIYTKTVKTAGTSVESYFEPYCMPEGAWEFLHSRKEYISKTGIIGYRSLIPENWGEIYYRPHLPAKTIKKRLDETLWHEYFKFCVIRNPFDKLVSAFHFKESRLLRDDLPEQNKRQIEKSLLGCKGETTGERFRDWIAKGGCIIDRDKYTIDGAICVDYFIRFEKLEDGVRHVCEILEVPFEPERIPRLKSGIRPKELCFDDYYDLKTIDVVAEKYDFEINYFGYAPEF